MHELAAWWAAHPEAASPGLPLGQDGRPPTCDISGPRRPPGTFDTPNCTVSSVPVGWWRSGAANWKTPVDFFLQRYGTRGLYGASSRGIPVKSTRVLLKIYTNKTPKYIFGDLLGRIIQAKRI